VPIREHCCTAESCDQYGVISEHFYHVSDPDPVCECGKPMTLMISQFQVVFTGPLTARYNDKKLDGAHQEGYFMTEKHTPDGKEKITWVDSWSERKRILKQEGLVEAPGSAEVGSDGKSIGMRGFKGQWV
jgi:hypothetical protein